MSRRPLFIEGETIDLWDMPSGEWMTTRVRRHGQKWVAGRVRLYTDDEGIVWRRFTGTAPVRTT